MSNAWVVALTGVAADGNVTQLYPDYCPAGVAAGAMGELRRKPARGILRNCQIMTDGTNGGVIELYDIDGATEGADVNTLAVITDAQLDAGITAGRVRKIWEQRFTGSAAAEIPIAQGVAFARGLAARAVMSTGSCKIVIVADGGFLKTEWTG